ncbi:hypothetical protein L345_16837, partial [Ophiophagus hannah]
VTLLKTLTKEKYTFNCGRWLDINEDDNEIVRELAAEGPLVAEVMPVIKYRLTVCTGTVSGSGTDANVFACLIGEHGDTGDRVLQNSVNTVNKFEKGSADEFIMEAVHLKQISDKTHSRPAGQGDFRILRGFEKLNFDPQRCDALILNLVEFDMVQGLINQPIKDKEKHQLVKSAAPREIATKKENLLLIGNSRIVDNRLEMFVKGTTDCLVERVTEVSIDKCQEDKKKSRRLRSLHQCNSLSCNGILYFNKIGKTHRYSGPNCGMLEGKWLDKNEDDGQIVRELVPDGRSSMLE